MTAIVGLIADKRVWLGSDSAGVNEGTLAIRKDGKVWRIPSHDMVLGTCGSMRISQLLRYRLQPPPIEDGQDVLEYMSTSFADAVAACLRDNGKLETTNGVQVMEAHILVGFRSRLFSMDAAMAVMEVADPYAAIGCGAPEALGALYVSSMWEAYTPKALLGIALKCSERFNTDVAGPFHIVSTESEEEKAA